RDEAGGMGAARAGDVEGGAVFGGGPDEWQAESNIDCMIESLRLDGDQSLIMIHRKRHVVARPRRLVEERIGGHWAASVDALGLEPVDGWTNYGQVLVAERAILARAGVYARNGKGRTRDAEAGAQVACDNAAGFDHQGF